MSEQPTATLTPSRCRDFELLSKNWRGPVRDFDGRDLSGPGLALWIFKRRVDAVAFAARRGIRILEVG